MENVDSVPQYRSTVRGWSFLLKTKGWKWSAFGVMTSLLSMQLLLGTFAGFHVVEPSIFERGAVSIDIESGTLDQRVQELYAHLQLLPTVVDVTLVTGEQLLAEEQTRDASLVEFLDRYGMGNPFLDAFVVVPRDARAYEELRMFIEQENDRGGIGVTALTEITTKEHATVDLIHALRMIRTGVGILTLLAMVTSLFLACSVLVQLVSSRRSAMQAEVVMGALPRHIALPVIIGGSIVLVSALVVATVFAVSVVYLFLSSPESAIISSWLSHIPWAEHAYAASVIVGCEAMVLVVLSFIAGLIGSVVRT